MIFLPRQQLAIHHLLPHLAHPAPLTLTLPHRYLLVLVYEVFGLHVVDTLEYARKGFEYVFHFFVE